MTLDSAVMNLADAFVPGQGYVALSRVRSLSGLILRGFNATALEIDARVREYDKSLIRSSEAAMEDLITLGDKEIQERQKNTILRFGGTLEIQKPKEKNRHNKEAKVATHMETFILLEDEKTLEEIAEIR